MYRTILEGKLEGVDETTSIVSQSLNMKVDEVYFFQEKEGYHIAFTKDENNDEWIVFVPLEDEIKKENFILLEKEDVLSKEEIESKWQQNCTQCELIDSTPAMIDQIPLWELTYRDNSNRYVIEYILLKDGSVYEQLRLFRKYSEKG